MIVVAGIIVVSLAMLSGVVLQVGDWLQHRRSAQVRADAGAFAGGQLLGQCLDTSKFTAGQAVTNIHEMAKHFSGYSSAVPGAPFNPQFGGGSVTQPTFASNECSNLTLDVSLTDSNIPALMSFFPRTTIHSFARVQLQAIQIFKGSFPLAIPEVEPKFVAATFVDEAGGELSGCGATGRVTGTNCTYLLAKGATGNNLTPWTVTASPNLPAVSATLGKRIGVRIGMGAQPGTCAGTGGNDNWACFDASTNSQGALMLRDYAAGSGGAAQPAAPILRSVSPSNSCAPGFAPQFGTSPFVSDAGGATTCSVGASARVDFGTGATNPTLAKASGGVKAKVTATINGSTITLSPAAGSYDAATTTWLWTPSSGSATVPVSDAGSTSAYPITMSWQEQDGTEAGNTCTTAGSNKCKGNFDGGAAVGRITSATSNDEGPIKLMSVTQGGVAAYSLTPGTKTVNLEIRIQSSLGVTNPPVLQALRLTSNGGGRTTAVECDGPGNAAFDNSIINGCQTPYQINSSQICPDPAPPAGPADCVPTKQGNLGVTVTKALDKRFGNSCLPNNWPDYTKTGDLRVVVMMLTDFSALNGAGKTQVPVVNFAAFYMIGWTGDPCKSPWPFPGSEPNGGNIWGYFIKYVSLTQIPNGVVCDPNQITPCVPVLVR